MGHELTAALSASIALHVCALYPLRSVVLPSSGLDPGAVGGIEVSLLPEGDAALVSSDDIGPAAPDSGVIDAIAAIAADDTPDEAPPLRAEATPAPVARQAATLRQRAVRPRRASSSGAPTGIGGGDGGGGGPAGLHVALANTTYDPTVPPQPAGPNPPPSYPLDARRKGYEGTVALRFEVSADAAAHADRVEIMQSSGHEILDAAAEHAVRAWRFQPAMQLGRPMRYTIVQRFRFALTEP